jgi:hypothetical protein
MAGAGLFLAIRASDGSGSCCLINIGLRVFLADSSEHLSGGHILNVCVNAIHAGSTDDDPAKWRVTQGMLEHEIAKVRKAEAEHSGEKGKIRRKIGFSRIDSPLFTASAASMASAEI